MLRLFLLSLVFAFGYYQYASYYLRELEWARSSIFIQVQPYLKASTLMESYTQLKAAHSNGKLEHGHMIEYVHYDKDINSLIIDFAYQGKEKIEHTTLVISRKDTNDFVFVTTNAKIKDAHLFEWHPYELLFCYPVGGSCFKLPRT
jgi:hypothetical protein